MKNVIAVLLCLTLMFSLFVFEVNAFQDEEIVPYVVDFSATVIFEGGTNEENSSRATGLINSYGLFVSKEGSTLHISGQTYGSTEVVRSGFKNLTVQRRKSSSDSWEDYYEYGNVYIDAFAATVNTKLVVASGYQYRISCKHYAKKNILFVQTIANTSNIVTVS